MDEPWIDGTESDRVGHSLDHLYDIEDAELERWIDRTIDSVEFFERLAEARGERDGA